MNALTEAANNDNGLDTAAAQAEARIWKPLRFFNLYRLTLASVFIILYELGPLPTPLGMLDPRLFFQTSVVYLVVSVLSVVLVNMRRPAFQVQLSGQVLLDITFITILMHASGGVASGLGMLLVVSVANASMIAPERMAGFFAALATLAILAEQTFDAFFVSASKTSYSQAALLGAMLFATAILAHVLAKRAKESEALAAQRGIDLANMAQLTEYAIQQMQTGVIVVDPAENIHFVNLAARRLVGLADDAVPGSLQGSAPELAEQLAKWHQGKAVTTTFLELFTEARVLPRFRSIGTGESAGTLIFLEDASRANRQAQQIKLASLGRLSASIAHEIRNPLSAISHAGELLAESPGLTEGDERLTTIIKDQTRRVNAIIENILQLGRRDRSHTELIVLDKWLPNFVEEFRRTDAGAEALVLNLTANGMEVYFDPSHLYQILSNLCSNALRHAAAAGGKPRVEIFAGRNEKGTPFIEVRDSGPGVSPESRARLFEPFFTTEAKGTGLGLYISRELAECNHGGLYYTPSNGESRFRIAFSDTKPQFI